MCSLLRYEYNLKDQEKNSKFNYFFSTCSQDTWILHSNYNISNYDANKFDFKKCNNFYC